MILCSKLKLGFIHIPKTGGSTITAALAPYSDYGANVPPREKGGWQLRYHFGSKHMHAIEAPGSEGFLIAAFKRDPWDRALSVWSFNQMHPKETFEDFLQRLIDKPNSIIERYRQHGRHQCGFLEVCDWVGRFEHLEEDWFALARKVGIENPAPLEHRNQARTHKRRGVRHTEKSNALVATVWPDDCAEMGYSPPCTT